MSLKSRRILKSIDCTIHITLLCFCYDPFADQEGRLPSGPLRYGQAAPISLSTDNPIYDRIANKPTTYQNSTSISISDTYSAITVETSCGELDDGQAREFDNPLYGSPKEQGSHDPAACEQDVLTCTDVSYYEENQSEVQHGLHDQDQDYEVAI